MTIDEQLPKTDTRSFKNIDTTVRQYRDKAATGRRPVHGLDTETWQGDIFLIADSDGRYMDKDITAESVVQFLLHKKYQNAVNVFFNLGYDARVILKLLGNQLLDYAATRILSFPVGEYIVNYIPGKRLSIHKENGHHYVSFYDIAQFYRGTVPKGLPDTLENVYQANIGPLDAEYLKFKGLRGDFSPRFYRRHTNALRGYVTRDCQLAQALGEKCLEMFHSACGFYPRRLLSAGNLAEKWLINKGLAYPKFASIPYNIQEFSYSGFVAARIEMLRRGFIGRMYVYDLNNAYPAIIKTLPDLMDGEWVSGSTTIENKAAIGFFKINADVPDTKHVAPFPFKGNHKLYFPTGWFGTYATIEELRACERKSYYKIIDSHQFIPNSNYHPYAALIDEFDAKRRELKAKGDPLYIPFKVIPNSLYGKSVEIIRNGWKRKIGNMCCPVIGVHITGTCRAQQYRFIREHNIEKETVASATDSVFTTRNLGINSDKLGEYALKAECEDGYFVQNGIYRVNGQWKSRGYGKIKGIAIDEKKIVEHNGKLCAEVEFAKSLGLKEAIKQNRIAEVGKILDALKYVNFNADRKRCWLGELERLDDGRSNYSIPWSFNVFTKKEI